MPYPIEDALAQTLVSLEPWTLAQRAEPVRTALLHLLNSEKARRGEPDEKTGALNVLSITQGTWLKHEYELSAHAHHTGWTVGAVIADVREMISVNARHGFPAGDALLKGMVQALSALFPGAKILRVQGDAFAVLLTPSTQLALKPEHRQATQDALHAAAPLALGAETDPLPPYTVALLELTVEAPSHWQVLGPLLWAEMERAYLLERRGQAEPLQRRRLNLNGTVPPLPER